MKNDWTIAKEAGAQELLDLLLGVADLEEITLPRMKSKNRRQKRRHKKKI